MHFKITLLIDKNTRLIKVMIFKKINTLQVGWVLIFQRTPERSERISFAPTSHDSGVTLRLMMWQGYREPLSLLAQDSIVLLEQALGSPQYWCTDTKMDNSGKEKEAMALMAEAEKKMKSSQSFFGALFGWVCHFGYYLANVVKLKANRAGCFKHIDWQNIFKAAQNSLS